MFRSNFFCISLAVMVVASCKKDPLPTPLVANAGPDQIIMKPRNNTRLSGDLSRGSIVSYKWTTVAGPNPPNMDSDSNSIMGLQPFEMFVSNLEEGVYLFELMVTGKYRSTSTDTMKVTVLPDILTQDPSRIARFDSLWFGEDSCVIRINNIPSAISATDSIQVFMSSYYGGGPMSTFVPSSGWCQIQTIRSSGFWYEIINDVLIIHAAAYIVCGWDDAMYDVLIKWN